MPTPWSPAHSALTAAVSDRRPAVGATGATSALAFLFRLPARTLLGLLWVYQRAVSPLLPVVFSGACGCRFSPTCSHYAVDAVRRHGALAGSWLALRRLLKCTPLHPGGFDPVPATLRRPPVCFSISRSSTLTPST